MTIARPPRSRADLTLAARMIPRLERLVATVKGHGPKDAKVAAAIDTLKQLSRREGIRIAIVGGMAAIFHGYERFTKDIDIIVGSNDLDPLIRVAPNYGIKVIWRDPRGWHKLRFGGIDIEVVPEGGEPNPQAPTSIPGLKNLGVREGVEYATLEGWVETTLASNRILDQADVVQVVKKLDAPAMRKVRSHLGRVHRRYVRAFDELCAVAEQEKEQERERGGHR